MRAAEHAHISRQVGPVGANGAGWRAFKECLRRAWIPGVVFVRWRQRHSKSGSGVMAVAEPYGVSRPAMHMMGVTTSEKTHLSDELLRNTFITIQRAPFARRLTLRGHRTTTVCPHVTA